MKHTISILLQNEAGALTRVAGLFSSRGYNIDSLHVAPTQDQTISRLTLVTSGSDDVIQQICNQLLKLVNVVDLMHYSDDEHFQRELVLVKLKLRKGIENSVQQYVGELNATILDEERDAFTVEVTASNRHMNQFIDRFASFGEILTVVRSGSLAMRRGTQNLDH
ncbi:MAG: acetolactate synthase small subunit [Gammaproteobacteria bacterium]